MLNLIKFENSRYGLQNQWTGIVLPKTFRTKRGAIRHATKLGRKFKKTMHRIDQQMNKLSPK